MDQAISAIRQLAQSCGNLNGQVVGPADAGWHAYMNWVDECERQSRNIFADPAIVHGASTDRYWHIAAHSAPARMAALIMAEVRVQQERLTDLADRLAGYRSLRERAGELLVLDTNVLLHFQRIDKIDWREVVRADRIRLVLPLIVLDELDRKRNLGGNIARKARSAVRPLDALQCEIDEFGYGHLPESRNKTTVEYLLNDRGHRPQNDADEEIVDRAAFLHRVTSRPVSVVSNDMGMRTRTTARREDGIRAVQMPEKFRRLADE